MSLVQKLKDAKYGQQTHQPMGYKLPRPTDMLAENRPACRQPHDQSHEMDPTAEVLVRAEALSCTLCGRNALEIKEAQDSTARAEQTTYVTNSGHPDRGVSYGA